MANTKLTITFFLPTTSLSRVGDCMAALEKVLKDEHKARDFFTQIEGPFADIEGKSNGEKSTRSPELGRRDEPSAGDGDEPTDQPKRGRGRPRKSAQEGPGEATGERVNVERTKGTGTSEAPERAKPERARQGSDESSWESEGGGGSSERSRDNQRGNREAPRISSGEDRGEADDWGDDWGSGEDAETGEDLSPEQAVELPGDEWPDNLTPENVDRAVLNSLLGDHYRATGGKDRGLTLAIVERISGGQQLSQVPEKLFVTLAKAIIKDTNRYELGIKRPK